MYINLLAAISSFLFIGLAAIFGNAFSQDATDDASKLTSIFMFVGAISFLLGVVFGRACFRAGLSAGYLALLLISLPLQLYYATTDSFKLYGIVLLVLFALVALANLAGTRINPVVISMCRKLAA